MLFRFRNMPMYKDAKALRRQVRTLVQFFPKSEQFVLINQVLRAMDSVCLNIAEGINRQSDKDKAHFLNQSLTSLEEVLACFDLALDDCYIQQADFDSVYANAEQLGSQLIAFSKYLKKA